MGLGVDNGKPLGRAPKTQVLSRNPNPEPESRSLASVAKRFNSTRPHSYRYRANSAHIRESRPDSGLGFQVKAEMAVWLGVDNGKPLGRAPKTQVERLL